MENEKNEPVNTITKIKAVTKGLVLLAIVIYTPAIIAGVLGIIGLILLFLAFIGILALIYFLFSLLKKKEKENKEVKKKQGFDLQKLREQYGKYFSKQNEN